MNILYYTRPDFVQHAGQLSSGGMGTKTRAILDGWGTDHKIVVDSKIPSLSETQKEETWLPPEDRTESDKVIVSQFDVILIELMGLLQDPRDDVFKRIEELKNYPAPKVVYGSDSEIFRWTGAELDALKAITTLWIPNCKWQADYFRDFDLPVTHIVSEPINCDLFRPATEIKKVIIAGGAISYEKQTEFFIGLFGELSKMDTGEYQTAYVGSADLWGAPKPIDLELQHYLEEVIDIFHGNVSQSKVASILGIAAIVVLNPHYETCNRFHMEAMASGKPTVCGKHILYDERPVTLRFDSSVEDCIEKLSYLTKDFEELPDKSHGKTARAFADEYFAYEASLNALNTLLRGVV